MSLLYWKPRIWHKSFYQWGGSLYFETMFWQFNWNFFFYRFARYAMTTDWWDMYIGFSVTLTCMVLLLKWKIVNLLASIVAMGCVIAAVTLHKESIKVDTLYTNIKIVFYFNIFWWMHLIAIMALYPPTLRICIDMVYISAKSRNDFTVNRKIRANQSSVTNNLFLKIT